MKKLLLIFVFTILSCKAQEAPKVFSEKALSDVFVGVDDEDIVFSQILKKYEGKQIFVDVWASWCKDCIVGMPKVNQLQKDNPETVFLFLSLDKSLNAWRKGIKKYKVEGAHYYMKSGWKGEFASFLDLDWIPRYLIIDENQNIKLFRVVKADDKNIKAILK